MNDAAIAQIVTLILGIGALWINWKKSQSEIAKLRSEAAGKADADEEKARISFDRRIETYMTGLESRIKVLHADMEAVERKLRETRAEADAARFQVRELQKQLDTVKADRDRLELRVQELERAAAECPGGHHA